MQSNSQVASTAVRPVEFPTPLSPRPAPEGLHAAVIMDGNGRWAERRGLPRTFGHRAGAKTVEMVVAQAPELGIGTLTLYAFSCDNWKRPQVEVKALFGLFEKFLSAEIGRMKGNGIALSVVGRRDRLPKRLVTAIETAERATEAGDRLDLRIAVDYSARASILRAMDLALSAIGPQEFATLLSQAINARTVAPPVDLVVRTSGERRLSDFLLWESAYAELMFVDKLWPDFEASDLAAVVTEFRSRDRRFGSTASMA